MMSSKDRSIALAFGVTLGLAWLAVDLPRAEAFGCGFSNCGTNTAELRGTAIRGLSARGAFNPDGVRVVLGSVRMVPPSGPVVCAHSAELGYSIDVLAGALVARAPWPSTTVVQGACLLGATFDLDVPVFDAGQTTVKRIRLRIAQKSAVSTWFAAPERASLVATYQLIDVEKQASICPVKDGWMESWQVTGMAPDGSNPPGVSGQAWHTPTDHGLIVQGETYSDAVLADPERSSPDWFNIACAGSAISKLRLLGYDPMSTWSTRGERQATLKMLTAHYVAGSATAYTRTGTPLSWISAREGATALYHGMPLRSRIGPIEAAWFDTRPACLSHLRLWMDPSLHSAGESEAGDLLAIVQAGGPPPCTSPALVGAYWRTYTVDHVAH